MHPEPESSASETRVLVVDDNADARSFLTRALGGEAMLVHTAASGNAALGALAHFSPDAVLLDVDMPGMDGFSTCAALMDRHADLPVIFMTGLGDTVHIVRGFEVGACDYVTKPVAIAEVVARVRSHVGKARQARALREAILRSHGEAEGGADMLASTAALTRREAEVMSWVARGKTNRDIADILGMSPRTVNKHLEHIFEKLGVETRTAAVAASAARARGHVPAPAD